MRFEEYCALRDAVNEAGLDFGLYDFRLIRESWPSVRGGLLAGVAAAGLMSPFVRASERDPEPAVSAKAEETERTRAMYERAKDKNKYYSSPTARKLARMAEKGDEWATREIAWPKEHPLHEKGRPFFRNKAAHPDGLKFNSGFEDD